MMYPPPGPTDTTYAPHFRLPGFDGAALFLRSLAVPGESGPRLAFDVMLLAPDYHAWYLSRAVGEHTVGWLSAFLFAAGDDFSPEDSVVPFHDPELALTLRVMSSTDETVELEVHVAPDPDAPDDDVDGLNFVTSRYALITAAEAVRDLDGSQYVLDEEGFSS